MEKKNIFLGIFLLFIFLKIYSQSQTPGGVKDGLQLWLRADKGASETEWKDQSLHSKNGILKKEGNASKPNLISSYVNFYPAYDFEGNRDKEGGYIKLPNGFDNFTKGMSLFILTNFGNGNLRERLIGFSNVDSSNKTLIDGIQIYGKTSQRKRKTLYFEVVPHLSKWSKSYIEDLLEEDKSAIYDFSLKAIDNTENFTAFKDGEKRKVLYRNRKDANKRSYIPIKTERTHNFIGKGYKGNNYYSYFNGHIGEIILYNRDLEDIERKKIQSYVAFKYGISLRQQGNIGGDYIASNGQTFMWKNSDAESVFTHNIFGIGRDDTSGLDQKISKSINEDGIVTLAHGFTSDFESENTAPTRKSLDNLNFITIANNHSEKKWEKNSSNKAPQGYTLLKRKWQVQKWGNKNSIGVTLAFDMEKIKFSPPGEYCDSYHLIIDDENDGNYANDELIFLKRVLDTDIWYAFVKDFKHQNQFTLARALNVVNKPQIEIKGVGNSTSHKILNYDNTALYKVDSPLQINNSGKISGGIAGKLYAIKVVKNGCEKTTYFRFGGNTFPGGVQDSLKLWLRADQEASKDTWRDISPHFKNGILRNNGTGKKPILIPKYKNFNPAYKFEGIDSKNGGYISLSEGFDNFDNGMSIFTFVNFGKVDFKENLIALGSGKDASTSVSDILVSRKEKNLYFDIYNNFFVNAHDKNYQMEIEIKNSDKIYSFLFKKETTFLDGLYNSLSKTKKKAVNKIYNFFSKTTKSYIDSFYDWYAGNKNSLLKGSAFINGEDRTFYDKSVIYIPSNKRRYNNFIGRGRTSIFDDYVLSYFEGHIGELILYNKGLEVSEHKRIESYLALKYGITLTEKEKATDYIASDGTTLMWSKNIAGNFTHDIFGIGRDDLSGLSQKISKSEHEDAIITLANDITKDFTSINSSPTRSPFTKDLSFFTIANNNGNAVWKKNNFSTKYKILEREWQLQKTGLGNKKITLAFDMQNPKFNVPNSECDTYYLIIDSDEDKNYTDKDTTIALKQIANTNIWYTSTDNLKNKFRFTLATTKKSTNDPIVTVINRSNKLIYTISNYDSTATYTSEPQLNIDDSGIITGGNVGKQYKITATKGECTKSTFFKFQRNVFPGGIKDNLQLWLRADKGATANIWKDQSSYFKDGILKKSGEKGVKPILNPNFINYNPAYRFQGIDELEGGYVELPNGFANFTKGMGLFTFADFGKEKNDENFASFGNFSNGIKIHRNSKSSNLALYTAKNSNKNKNNLISEIIEKKGKIYQFSLGKPNPSGKTKFKVFGNGENPIQGQTYMLENIERTNNFIGKKEIALGVRRIHPFFEGYVGEFILYNRDVNYTERKQIQSYLALKYGITLTENAKAIDYLASDGSSLMWSKNIAGNFTYNVFGIGRDDVSGLHQKISKSANKDAVVILANDTTNDFVSENSNNKRIPFADNLNFLTISNNNGTATWDTISYRNEKYFLLNRKWQAQKKGLENKIITLAFDLENTQFNIPNLNCSSYYLVLDTDNNGTYEFERRIELKKSTKPNSNIWYVSTNILKNKNRFTLATYYKSPKPTTNKISLCDISHPTIKDLEIKGEKIRWYKQESGGIPLNEQEILKTGMYYVSQTIGNFCESDRKSVFVSINKTKVPEGNRVQKFCHLDSPSIHHLSATGSDIKWYNSSRGGTLLAPDTILTDNVIYYASQTIDGCESNSRLEVTVSLSIYNDCGDTDGDGIRNANDIDDDNDGIPDLVENNGDINNDVDTDGDGIPNREDLDSDNDGINDVIEAGNGILDTNNDGFLDKKDKNYTDFNKDGQADNATKKIKDTDGDRIPNGQDLDSDDDGINDVVEGGNEDADNNAKIDGTDGDGDGILDAVDDNPTKFGDFKNTNIPTDTNTDGILDMLDPNVGGNGKVFDSGIDKDKDGISDSTDDNDIIFGEGIDTDGDGIIDTMDIDDDNDGIPDTVEGDEDTDGDGIPNHKDLDSDNDGVNDIIEAQYDSLDTNKDSFISEEDRNYEDANRDGRADTAININGYPDTDGDGIPDFIDLDSDDDGINDILEAGNKDLDKNGKIDGKDTDGDGILDAVDEQVKIFGDKENKWDLPKSNNIPDMLDPNIGGNGKVFDSGSDADKDGISDSVDDNNTIFGEGIDTDKDGITDSVDVDDDNDGIPDIVEADIDTDGDGVPNQKDLDSDNDGINDVIEGGNYILDTNHDGIIDKKDKDYEDSNKDGQSDNSLDIDEDPDTDNDGIPDYIDLDTDDDGMNDVIEGGNQDSDNNGKIDGEDTDGDGILDAVDQQSNDFGDGKNTNFPIDSDQNGVLDVLESTVGGSKKVSDSGMDKDGDGIADSVDGFFGFGDAYIAPINLEECITDRNYLMSIHKNSTVRYLHIDCIEEFPNNFIEIYNRWGNVIYRMKRYSNINSERRFEGFSNTVSTININSKNGLSEGTYFYRLDLGNGKAIKKGWIYINK